MKPSTDWVDEFDNTEDDKSFYAELMSAMYRSRHGRDYWWPILLAKVKDDCYSVDETENHSQGEIKKHIKKITK